MKKMMIIATVAFAAIAANATTLKWGLLTGTLDTTKVDKGTAYLCYYTGSTANWATDLAKLTAFDAATITDTMGMKLVKVADSTDPTQATANNATFDYNGVDKTKVINHQDFITPASFGVESGAASFYYVVIDDGGKDIAYTTAAQTGTMNVQTGNSSKLVMATTFSYAEANVPEPTSAMLLLLGVAGLALRRRRA